VKRKKGHPHYDHIGEMVAKAIQSNSHANPSENETRKDISVVIVGHGNVAIDCARILAKAGTTMSSSGSLYDTDISLRAWNVLSNSKIHNIEIVGRRGHVQASFTIKELRELVHLERNGFDTSFIVRDDELNLCTSTEATQEELHGPNGRPKARMDKLLREAASKGTASFS
jgi:adrenodoxin-NADP+ reductase